jgi:hypothetical protein
MLPTRNRIRLAALRRLYLAANLVRGDSPERRIELLGGHRLGKSIDCRQAWIVEYDADRPNFDGSWLGRYKTIYAEQGIL